MAKPYQRTHYCKTQKVNSQNSNNKQLYFDIIALFVGFFSFC